jgi:hypothetical protein
VTAVDPLTECIEDLHNELRWLLCAATEWDAERSRKEDRQPCFHIQVYAMDSALLHARSLYEFFTATDESIKRNKQNGSKRLTWRDFGTNCRQESNRYKKVIGALHGRVMHLDRDRTGYEQVKEQVVNLAEDILSLWDCFCNEPVLQPYASLLRQKRDEAIAEARKVATQYAERNYRLPFC